MRTKKHLLLALFAALALVLGTAACSDDDDNGNGSPDAGTDTGNGGDDTGTGGDDTGTGGDDTGTADTATPAPLTCKTTCSESTDCETLTGTPICHSEGRCVACESNTDCENNPTYQGAGFDKCTDDNRCVQCTNNTECEGVEAGDTCVNGSCTQDECTGEDDTTSCTKSAAAQKTGKCLVDEDGVNRCVRCEDSDDCKDGETNIGTGKCDLEAHTCTLCENSDDCSFGVCDVDLGRCVQCRDGETDCDGSSPGNTGVCANNICIGCTAEGTECDDTFDPDGLYVCE